MVQRMRQAKFSMSWQRPPYREIVCGSCACVTYRRVGLESRMRFIEGCKKRRESGFCLRMLILGMPPMHYVLLSRKLYEKMRTYLRWAQLKSCQHFGIEF